jgi:hypothetical protein
MAYAKVVCSECGAAVAAEDKFCGSCGVKLEEKSTSPPAGGQPCAVCGHGNAAGATYCESCGARLGGRKKAGAPQRKPDRSRPESDRRRGIEPWQVISLIAVLALLGYFVYTALEGDQPRPRSEAATSAMQGATPAPDFTVFEQALVANPKDEKALLQYGNALFDAGAYPRAIDLYKRYLALKPDNPDARVDLGICYFELAKLDSAGHGTLFASAISEMEAVAKSHPNHQQALFNLGIVNLTMKNVEESQKWFKRAVQSNATSDLGVRAQRILEQHASMPK